MSNKSVADRFWGKIQIVASGCWEWTAALNELGYAKFWDGKNNVRLYLLWIVEYLTYNTSYDILEIRGV